MDNVCKNNDNSFVSLAGVIVLVLTATFSHHQFTY